MGGAIWGQRHVYFSDHMKFEDAGNNLKAIIAFGNARKELKGKKIHEIYGQLFKYKFSANELKKPFYSEYIPSYPFPSKKEDVRFILNIFPVIHSPQKKKMSLVK